MEQLQFKHEEETLTASLSLPAGTMDNLKLEVIEATRMGNKSKILEHLYNKYKDDPAHLMLSCFILGDMVSQSIHPFFEIMEKDG